MSAGAESKQLTHEQISRLAEVIAKRNMESIAIRYLGISFETVDNYRIMYREDTMKFNRDIMKFWRNRNPDNSCQVG